jgi:hypothetical protein
MTTSPPRAPREALSGGVSARSMVSPVTTGSPPKALPVAADDTDRQDVLRTAGHDNDIASDVGGTRAGVAVLDDSGSSRAEREAQLRAASEQSRQELEGHLERSSFEWRPARSILGSETAPR